jgi:hypothetical protein
VGGREAEPCAPRNRQSFAYSSCTFRSRKALVTTDTERNAIAAPANMGESSIPATG